MSTSTNQCKIKRYAKKANELYDQAGGKQSRRNVSFYIDDVLPKKIPFKHRIKLHRLVRDEVRKQHNRASEKRSRQNKSVEQWLFFEYQQQLLKDMRDVADERHDDLVT